MKPPTETDIEQYVHHAIDDEGTISSGGYWFEYDYETDVWKGERTPGLWYNGADKHLALTTDELIGYIFDTLY